jgi:hypothetical protein
MVDPYEDIEEELQWEKTQEEIAQKASNSEKKGWGYSNFKALIRAKIAHLSDDRLVEDFQAFLLQKNFTDPIEWAYSYYDEWYE